MIIWRHFGKWSAKPMIRYAKLQHFSSAFSKIETKKYIFIIYILIGLCIIKLCHWPFPFLDLMTLTYCVIFYHYLSWLFICSKTMDQSCSKPLLCLWEWFLFLLQNVEDTWDLLRFMITGLPSVSRNALSTRLEIFILVYSTWSTHWNVFISLMDNFPINIQHFQLKGHSKMSFFNISQDSFEIFIKMKLDQFLLTTEFSADNQKKCKWLW